MVGSSLGMIGVPIITPKLLIHFGWRISYLVLGALPLLIAFPLVALFVRERKEHSAHDFPPPEMPAAEGSSRAFWILLATLFLGAMSTTGTITQLSALLTDRGIKVSAAGFAVAAVGASSLAGRLVTGWLLDRFFAPRLGMILLFTTAAGLFLLSTAQTLSTGIAASVLIGFSMGGESDVAPYLLARYFGLRKLALLYGWTWTAYAIAAALGSILLGRAFDRSGTYASLLVLYSLATFVAGALMLGMPRYPEEDVTFEIEIGSAQKNSAATRA
jgi:predicted MFS family arabinose efflux permease